MKRQWSVLFIFPLLFINGVNCQNVQDYRLPADIYPNLYSLVIVPDIENLLFKGELTIKFTTLKNVSKIIFNSKNLLISPNLIVIQDQNDNSIGLNGLEEQKDLERIVVIPARTLESQKLYSIRFLYQGNITEDGWGLYRTTYTDQQGTKQWLLTTQLRPVHARKVYPCLDDPSFRAVFRLSVRHDPSYSVISNMPAKATTLIPHTYGTDALTEFQDTPPIPVFLTGFMVSRLEAVLGQNMFQSLAVPQDLLAVSYSAQIGPKLAKAMESLVLIRYPQVKTDQVALPRLIPVGMENWGLFNFRPENILYTEGVSPNVQRQTVARFSGHEIAHAWLGNSVTIVWWDYLWLSEMFAMYLEYYLPHIVNPDWRMEEQMVIELHMSGLAGDSPTAEPLTTTVLTPDQISAKFSGLTYTKAPALLRMVQHILTTSNFFKGIKSYLEKNWSNSVLPSFLWSALEAEGSFPTSLDTIMSGWTDKPGYPLVSAKWANGAAIITQSPYSADGEAVGNATWWIPISYSSTVDPHFTSQPKVWLAPGHQVTIPLPPGGVLLLNIYASAFYRVNYDEPLLEKLIELLKVNHKQLPALNRAQLVDDSIALAISGHLKPQLALELVSYLSSELDFIVWKSASVSLMLLANVLVNSEIYSIYKNFVLSLLTNVYTEVSLVEHPNDGHADYVKRQIVVELSCRMGINNCAVAANDYINSLLQGNHISVSPDVRQALLCTAIQGNPNAWKNIMPFYLNGTTNKAEYLKGLACSKDPELIKALLMTSESSISDQEWTARFTALASQRENANNLLLSLYQNVNKIISRFGTKGLSGFISQISNYLGTRKHLEVIGDFERLGVSDLSTTKRKVEGKINWLDTNTNAAVTYFKSNKRFGLIF